MFYGYGILNNHVPTLRATTMGGAASTKLLDTYTGAAFAYSLRKLRTAYTGYAIRVRRSSDNTTLDIGFDGNGNLDTTSILSFVGANNGFVSIWYDQSINSKNSTQPTSTLQPQIVSSGVLNSYNSRPCVKFDGNGDYIETAYYTGTSNEFYFVTQTTDTQFVFPRGSDYYGFIAEQSSSTTNTSGYFSTQPTFYVNSALVSPTNRGAVYTLLTGYKLSLHKGANISTTTNNLRFGNFNLSPGSLDFNGNLFEFIAYPSLQSSQTSIESNINTYYSIY